MKRILFAAGMTLLLVAAVGADDVKPAVVFDMGGKFDKSFNEGIYNGVERFREETGIEYGEFEVTNEAQREQALRNFARRGYNPIIAVGFGQGAGARQGGRRVSRYQFLDHRHGGGPAQRTVDRVQGA